MWSGRLITTFWLILWLWSLQVFAPGVATDFSQSPDDTFVDDAYYYACRVGDIEVIRSYLEKISVHSRDSKGNTCIIIAAGRGQVEILRLLLAHGANPQDATMSGIFEGKTAICWAASQGRTDAVALLMKAGADPQRPPAVGTFAGKNALMWAASQGRANVVHFLVAAGVAVDYSSSSGKFKGKTALMWASSQGRYDCVEALLAAGSNVNAVDADGLSALMWASGSEAKGDDVHKKALFEKAMKGHVQVVNLLLKYGAEVDRKDKDLITALMFASFNGHDGAVQALLNAGADADFINRSGKTALMLARSSGNLNVVEVIENGPSFQDAVFEELEDLSVCGWILSILRAPKGTGIIFDRNYLNHSYQSSYSINKTCPPLKQLGFDSNMKDLLVLINDGYATTSISLNRIEEFTEVLYQSGILHYAGKLRAKQQLMILNEQWKSRIIAEEFPEVHQSHHECRPSHHPQLNSSSILHDEN